jgi:K+-sensing histidine kinase KdpD/ActR/RegA family two-component response regulator
VAYVLSVPAVAVGVLTGLALTRAGASPLAATPLALAIALTGCYGGLGPGLFALIQSAVAVDFFFLEPGSLFRFTSGAQALALFAFVIAWLIFCLGAGQIYRRLLYDRLRRVAAERASWHANRLAQLTAALAKARTPRSVIEAAVQEPLHALKADAGMLLLTSRDGTTAEIARAVAYPPEYLPSTVMLSDKSPISDAVGRGAPVMVESRKARLAEYTREAGHRPDRFEATADVPLMIGSRVVGVVQLDFESPRTFSLEDREYVLALATYTSQALDRAWQLEAAERARSDAENLREHADEELTERKNVERALRASETLYRALAARTSRLHGLSAALSEAVTMDAVARAVIHHGSIVIGALAGELALLVDNGTQLETLYAEPADRNGTKQRRPAIEDGSCVTQVVQTGRPVFVKSLTEWQERYWRSASVAADNGYQSSATMPLLVEGAPIGVLSFHFTAPVNFDDEYRALLTSVAQHCAQALDRARLYESTQRARADAEQANRIKDEFVSIVSHELRTPLNAILGWTTILQRASLTPDKAARALQSISQNASRQARLIEELLDFSRVASGRTSFQMENVDMRELVRGIVESMMPTAVERGIELRLSPVPPVAVLGDLRRLEQIFFNLVDNALKFSMKGGIVSIDVRIADRYVAVAINDNGAGIEPEFLPLVFDRFRQGDSTTSRTYGGLGLGLSIAKQLVEAHQGAICAESAGKHRGATFTVQLPVAATHVDDLAEHHAIAPSADEAEPRLDGIRVLLVEDEADAREIMAQTLEDSGASVKVAGNVHDALEILKQDDMDVLLADLAMPEEDGFALIRNVRSSPTPQVASIPAAAVTAFTRDEYREHALAAGFHLHLKKPVEPAELVRAVNILARRAIH